MRQIAVWAAFSILAAPCSAAIVDRVAVIVGSKIITHSEIDRRIRLTALQNGSRPDMGRGARRAAAQQLIDQKLVEREMEIGRYPRLQAQRRQELLAGFEKANFNSDHAALMSALAAYRVSLEDLAEDLGRQADLLAFLNVRFRPAVQVTEQDIDQYLKERLGQRQQGSLPEELNDLRSQIEEQLTVERSDKQLDAWLREQRKTTKIEFVEADLKPVEEPLPGRVE